MKLIIFLICFLNVALITFACFLLPVMIGNNDLSKTPPDKIVASMTKHHCNQLICIVHKNVTGI